MPSKNELWVFEVDLLLEAIFFRYGYDFRHYSRASLERRVENRLALSDLSSPSEMITKVLHEPAFFELFLKDMSITVTDMFRDPHVFRVIREVVFKQLRTYSRVNIWHAGCATGEEVYSMAIMLHEEGLLKRTRIYATDYNNRSLEVAQQGIYPVEKMQEFTANYHEAGGKGSLADYYQAKYEYAKINDIFNASITFANHNLVKDQVFAQMNLIVCRNVLIYFDQHLQDQVLTLFANSLVHRGYLVLGDKETLALSKVQDEFECVSYEQRIYRKLAKV
ncbi:protein-glutamate O-methyltransferase CheR [Psychrobium sp. 1_MG-2023]|uniref:CheR family methyltransferase n=1 Tax=Psychrobium sp. 1_MG-2023 TaxID=3062624 RepID=UPI000C323298|nr:protein-glutamate O-methyltransferase CheR [Psychrobium sp. 1_MG-2023]MDP2560908.1 protein-glutamate O-methyltransferase CheR [Psychrobium sp. 1_MG-2023]PKF55982.1 chemotaxis protein CheR [Alteromonadales bacterium alter-6D02]